MKLVDKFINAMGFVIFILALSIAMLGMTWHYVKPFVEKEELKYVKTSKDINMTE
jgi:hypothetical protein